MSSCPRARRSPTRTTSTTPSPSTYPPPPPLRSGDQPRPPPPPCRCSPSRATAAASPAPPPRPTSPDTPTPASSPPQDPTSRPPPLPPQPPASDTPAASNPGGRRRTCARCSKGGIGMGNLGEREECLACGARYCAGCVLRAMGSMPEGRKCFGCIGRPVEDVRRRARLGRGSRLLARLLAPAKVRQVMRAERGCAANQVLPDEIVVNGRGLSQDELDLLLGCAVPPERLAPGRYWYDKDSGLWGKEGERPDRIVTSKFSVGGKLRADASNGAAQVFINGREITKTELRMLKGIIHHLFKILIRVFTGFSFSWPMYSAPEILISGYMMTALTRRGKT